MGTEYTEETVGIKLVHLQLGILPVSSSPFSSAKPAARPPNSIPFVTKNSNSYFVPIRVFRTFVACSQPGTCPRTCVRGKWAKLLTRQFRTTDFTN